jgi:hypothetical protein
MVMAEVEERIARIQQLLAGTDTDCDETLLRYNLRLLQQLRAEVALAPVS